MSSKSSQTKNKKKNQISGRLKPWLGIIPPIIYVPVLFTSALVWLICALFISPGIRHYGSLVRIDSQPEGAAVYVGEKLAGSTPLETFIPAGEHTIRLEKPYFETIEIPAKIKGRLFFSLFFPKRQSLKTTLQLSDLRGWLAQAYYEASSWYSIGADKVHGREPVITEMTSHLIEQWDKIEDKDLVLQWIASLRDLIQDQDSWHEVNESWKTFEQAGVSLPDSLIPLRKANSFENFINIAKKMPSSALAPIRSVMRPISIRAADLTFVVMPGGEVEMGRGDEGLEFTPTTVRLDPFYYMIEYLSAKDFTRLSEEASTGSDLPVVNINMKKVRKVINAVNARLKEQGITNLQASLPSEAQWQHLAQSKRIQPELFEWTADNYIPYRLILHAGQAAFAQPFETREKVVRGESIFSGPMPLWYRFGFPEDHASPYISMRLVLVPKS